MGHLAGKDIYRRLGEKIDNLTVRVQWNETLHSILTALYSAEEADVVVKMPYSLSSFSRIEKTTGYEKTRLRNILDGLCSKGLVIDLWINDEYRYMASPMVVGIFEFTMMKARQDVNETKKLAKLFHKYMLDDDRFFAVNSKNNEQVSLLRALPHEESIKESAYAEILDYEKARSLIEEADKFAIGLCACRHATLHAGKKTCDTPLNTCSQFGAAADYMIRHKLAGEVSKTEMLENLARSRELGLVLNADNVKRNITFICHCCKCCCHALLGISKFGYPNTIVTSTLIAETDEDLCNGCGKCEKACPVNAIKMVPSNDPKSKKKKQSVDKSVCIGCGVCALHCKTGGLKLVKRGKRVIHPETTFERVILQCLDHGTLQNQMFDDPQRLSHKFMRGFIGGFLKLQPVKKALMSDILRSRFLDSLKKGAKDKNVESFS